MLYYNFLFINRGFDKTIWFLPGWAFDFRIFIPVSIPFNYLFYTSSLITDFKLDHLIKALNALRIYRLSILAWSMGGSFFCRISHDLLRVIPVERIFISNTAKRFPQSVLFELKEKLRQDKTSTLIEFYRLAFLGHKMHKKWFEKELLSNYLKVFSTRELEAGLDCLSNDVVLPNYNSIDCTLIYGLSDPIVSKDMWLRADPDKRGQKLVVFNSGHISFFHRDFSSFIFGENDINTSIIINN